VAACVTVGALAGSGLPVAAQDADEPPIPPAIPAIGDPGSTDRISLVASRVQDGWRYDQYRNPAYPCAVSGDNTFIIATALGTPATAVRPLWVYMHGGGFGYFDSAGTPQPMSS